MDAETSSYTNLSLDVWTSDITSLRVSLVDFNGTGYNGGADNTEGYADIDLSGDLGSWYTIDLALADGLEDSSRSGLEYWVAQIDQRLDS